MKKTLKKILRLLIAGVFLVSIAMFARQMLFSAGADKTYEEAWQIAMRGETPAQQEEQTQPEILPEWIPAPVEKDEHMLRLEKLSLEALRQVNPEVVGWIQIPGSKVNYPIMQGEDNQYYLNRTWEGKRNSAGSIFLEYRNSGDFSDFNTILYGHNRSDGSMFASISSYFSQWYLDGHPYVYLVTDQGVLRYEVFSAYRTEVESETYRMGQQKEESRRAFLDMALERSEMDMGVIPETSDRVLTLSTCTAVGYSTRWVVHARLKMVKAE